METHSEGWMCANHDGRTGVVWNTLVRGQGTRGTSRRQEVEPNCERLSRSLILFCQPLLLRLSHVRNAKGKENDCVSRESMGKSQSSLARPGKFP